MKLLVLSDLHHEIWREHAPSIAPDVAPDLVILAGDIAAGAKAVEWAAERFPSIPVVYVHGNHEAYGYQLEDVQVSIEAMCDNIIGVHFLNCSEFRLHDCRILGTTLWTDFDLYGSESRDEAIRASENVVMDFKRIRLRENGGQYIRATDMIALHNRQKQWLDLKLAEPFEGKTIVVTHMAPSIRSIAHKYAHDLSSAAFASNLDYLVEKATLWVHGHTHDTFDYFIGQCRVICNPCGYINRSGGPENFQFNPNWIVEV